MVSTDVGVTIVPGEPIRDVTSLHNMSLYEATFVTHTTHPIGILNY